MRFSVVTPSFRNGNWLRLCIASVADQGVEVEHIVQDAGSDDGTLEWLPSDRRVKAFVERDAGMYDAINRGLRRARGDILAYLNCDEQYLPGALKAVDSYFKAFPEVDVLFADTVAVGQNGEYLFHRKVLRPGLYHTWLHPLSTLSCATFFQRRVVSEWHQFFDPHWRIIGDRTWVLELLRRKARTAVLRQFTSVFTLTGSNLSLDSRNEAEQRELVATAPGWLRGLRPAVLLHHRLRRSFGGVYFQAPFEYGLYTSDAPDRRRVFKVTNPTSRWRW